MTRTHGPQAYTVAVLRVALRTEDTHFAARRKLRGRREEQIYRTGKGEEVNVTGVATWVYVCAQSPSFCEYKITS